jgi:DNA-binding transcriptional regulator GbsR (MarR family)
MGSAWGISRTMAEVHALLYITGEPLNTDDVMERLNISRGNASMTLRSLTDWGIVHRSHKRGDRKEYFHAEDDIWVMFRTIARERKKRELDPIVTSLFDIRDMTRDTDACTGENATRADRHNHRLDEMLDFFNRLDALAEGALAAETDSLRAALGALTDDAVASGDAEDDEGVGG